DIKFDIPLDSLDFKETVTQLISNDDGTYTYINEDGDEADIKFDIPLDSVNFKETLTKLEYDPETRQLMYQDEDSIQNYIQLDSMVQDSINFKETTTYIVDNGDRTFTYTNEDGEDTTIDFGEIPLDSLDFKETLTKLRYKPESNELVYHDEN